MAQEREPMSEGTGPGPESEQSTPRRARHAPGERPRDIARRGRSQLGRALERLGQTVEGLQNQQSAISQTQAEIARQMNRFGQTTERLGETVERVAARPSEAPAPPEAPPTGRTEFLEAAQRLSQAAERLTAERLAMPEDRNQQLPWLRENLELLEATGTSINEYEFQQLYDAIVRRAAPELRVDLLNELQARFYLHNATIELGSTRLEGFARYMGAFRLEWLNIIRSVEGSEEAIEEFDQVGLTNIFSAPEVLSDEIVLDRNGQRVMTYRDYKNYLEQQVYLALNRRMTLDARYQATLPTDPVQREKRLRLQSQTAVNLIEKVARVTGVAAESDMPKFDEKTGAVRKPEYKIYKVLEDGTVVPKVDSKGKQEEVPIKSGTGDYSLWINFYMYPYTVWRGKGYEELRKFVRTGLVSFESARLLSETNGALQSEFLLRAASGEKVPFVLGRDYGIKELFRRIERREWTTSDFGSWLGNIADADATRKLLESRKGFLYSPSPDDVDKLATEAYGHFKDKQSERQAIFARLYEGMIRFNINEKTVKKYYGEHAIPWTEHQKDYFLRRAVLANEISQEQADELKKIHVSFWNRARTFVREYLAPAIETGATKFVQGFFAGIGRAIGLK